MQGWEEKGGRSNKQWSLTRLYCFLQGIRSYEGLISYSFNKLYRSNFGTIRPLDRPTGISCMHVCVCGKELTNRLSLV